MVPDETLAEGLTEVQRLEHRVGVARVAEVLEAVVAFAVRDLSVELLLQSGGAVTLRTRAGEGTRWAGDRAVSTGTARLGALEHSQRGWGCPRERERRDEGWDLGDGRTIVSRAFRDPPRVERAHRARPGVSLSARSTPPSDVASSRLVSSCGESFVASVCTPTLRVSSDGRPAAPAPLLDAQTRRGRIEEGPPLPPRPWWRDISLTASPSSVAGARARLRPSARCRTTSCSAASSPPASRGLLALERPVLGPVPLRRQARAPRRRRRALARVSPTTVLVHRVTLLVRGGHRVGRGALHGVQLELDKSCACALGFRGFRGFHPRSHANAREYECARAPRGPEFEPRQRRRTRGRPREDADVW